VASAVAEEYLETIYNMEMEGDSVIAARLAEKFNVSRPTVTETLRRLVANGFAVVRDDRTIGLTDSGREVTESVLRRHRLAERMLFELLGMDWIQAHEQAHTIEHGMTEDLASRISERLGHPLTCPHGNPIPGNALSGLAFLRERNAFRLADAKPGDEVEVVLISEVVEDESQVLREVGEVGLHPRAHLTMLPTDDPDVVRFELKETERTMRRDLATKLWVSRPADAERPPSAGPAE
jgi:DtxR family transcriptional regulator, Mn-dependent transcriptional regulator